MDSLSSKLGLAEAEVEEKRRLETAFASTEAARLAAEKQAANLRTDVARAKEAEQKMRADLESVRRQMVEKERETRAETRALMGQVGPQAAE